MRAEVIRIATPLGCLVCMVISQQVVGLSPSPENGTWQSPETVDVASVRRIDPTGHYPQFILEVVADLNGDVHVFMTASPHHANDDSGGAVIEHRTIRRNKVSVKSDIPAVKSSITSIVARPLAGGGIGLAWVEEGVPRLELGNSRIYTIRLFPDGKWSTPEVITEPVSRPFPYGPNNIDLLSRGEQMDLFWVDWRHQKFLSSMFSSEADHATVYVKQGGKATTRLSKRKRSAKKVAATGNGEIVHAVWSEQHRPYSRRGYNDVFYSFLLEDEWSSPSKVSDNRNSDGTPGNITRLDVAPGRANDVLVAWISSQWISESEESTVLELRSLSPTSLSEGSIQLSTEAVDCEWVDGAENIAGLLVQEGSEEDGLQLDFINLENLSDGQRTPIASRVLEGQFDGAVAADGTIYVVYVAVDRSGRARLEYRVRSPD